jgi:ferredoxin
MILQKDKLNDWLLAFDSSTLVAPVMDEVIVFKTLDDPTEIHLDGKSVVPPKRAVLPQTEKMFKFKYSQEMEIEEGDGPEETVIFGIRPCDARGLAVLDRVFSDESADGYYLDRRGKAALIGLACEEPCANCFCTSFDSGPGHRGDVDVLLTDLGDRYYVDVVTEKGKSLVGLNEKLFSDPSAADTKEMETAHSTAEEKVERKVDVEGLPGKLDAAFDSDYWGSVAMRCLGCGICTYVCPTCHCFDIQDELRGQDGRRVRTWDSCMYPEYTIHTSGHNHCPVNIDIIEVMGQVGEGIE